MIGRKAVAIGTIIFLVGVLFGLALPQFNI